MTALQGFWLGVVLGAPAWVLLGWHAMLLLSRPLPRPWRRVARAWRYLAPGRLPGDVWRYLAPGTVWRDVRRCWTTGRWT